MPNTEKKENSNYLILDRTVYPSKEKTVLVENSDEYGGAHSYKMQNSTGFKEGKAHYVDTYQTVQFVKKESDGTMTPGIQSEQLVIALLDRTQKLNARFPSQQNAKMIQGLEIFLKACRERIEDRITRGVMGDLKK